MAQKNKGYFIPLYDTMLTDPRVKRLEDRFGVEGFGCYIKLCSLMRSYETTNLECKEQSFMIPEYDIPLIAKSFKGVSTKKLQEVVKFCTGIDLFKTFTPKSDSNSDNKRECNYIYSEEILNNFIEWQNKRAKQSEGGKKGTDIRYNKNGANEDESNMD